jgi:uncharacterized Zn-finger protein
MTKLQIHGFFIKAWELDKICKGSEMVMIDHPVFWLRIGISGGIFLTS